jgi:hypothetical protein
MADAKEKRGTPFLWSRLISIFSASDVIKYYAKRLRLEQMIKALKQWLAKLAPY